MQSPEETFFAEKAATASFFQYRMAEAGVTIFYMRRALSALLIGILLAPALIGSTAALAQNAVPLPPRTHSGVTMMGLKAQHMKDHVAREIAQARENGRDVGMAQRYKSEGDSALDAGHFRIAVDRYEAAEKALH